MQYTTNYNMTIAEGTDTVNLLTQCYPNFSNLDTVVKEVSDAAVTVAAETKVGTVHNLVRTSPDRTIIKFTATSNYTTGDTFTVDGVAVTSVTTGGTALKTGAFLINSNVLCILNGLVLTVLVSEANADASDITFDNTGTGLLSTDVQNAIEEVYSAIPSIPATYDADDIVYDNTGSGLIATNVQDAIDEIVMGSAVTVTADGVKTRSALLNELFAAIDTTKLTGRSIILEHSTTGDFVYQRCYTSGSVYQFMSGSIVPPVLGFRFVELAANSHFNYTSQQGNTFTINSGDNSVPASGVTYSVVY